MQFRRIKGQIILFDENKPIRLATKEERSQIERESSIEFKLSKMSFRELLNTYTKLVVEYSHGYHGNETRHTIEAYHKELLRRGSL